MEESVFLRITGVLGTLFLLGAFAMLVARQMRGCIRLYAGQSFILAAVAALTGFITGSTHLYLMAALTIIGKVMFIPYLMDRVVHDSILRKREIEFVVNIPGSLLISALLAALAFFTGKAMVFQGDTLTNLLLPVGAAVILIGLPVWAGAMDNFTAGNQYSATAYSNPVLVLFGSIYRPRVNSVSRYFSLDKFRLVTNYERDIRPIIELYLYKPLAGVLFKAADLLRWVQSGRVNQYLSYMLLLLVASLVYVYCR